MRTQCLQAPLHSLISEYAFLHSALAQLGRYTIEELGVKAIRILARHQDVDCVRAYINDCEFLIQCVLLRFLIA